MIASVVANVNEQTPMWTSTLETLRARPEIEIGNLIESRLPLTLEADDSAGLDSLTDWLLTLPGISHVNVIFVHFE